MYDKKSLRIIRERCSKKKKGKVTEKEKTKISRFMTVRF